MSKRRLLLLSNSKNPAQKFLGHATEALERLLKRTREPALFVPYAQIPDSIGNFTLTVRDAFERMGYTLNSIHETPDEQTAISRASAIVVGGGNTFLLLHQLLEKGLLEVIQRQVNSGIPFIGWSAGANIACPGINTTNDMPIIEVPTFKALGLVPFQINPHYTELPPAGHLGETRMERLREFTVINPKVYVAALRDGSMLQIEDSSVRVLGNANVAVFKHGEPILHFGPGSSLDFLLGAMVTHDASAYGL